MLTDEDRIREAKRRLKAALSALEAEEGALHEILDDALHEVSTARSLLILATPTEPVAD